MLRRGKEEATQPPLAVASARAPSGTASPPGPGAPASAAHSLPHPLLLPCPRLRGAAWTTAQEAPPTPTHGHRLSFDFLSRSSELMLLFNVILRTCAPALAHTRTHRILFDCFPLQDVSPVSSSLQFIYSPVPRRRCLAHRRSSMQIYLINKLMRDHSFKSSSIYKTDCCDGQIK